MGQQGGEKTEQPTDKRIRDSRRKGQVAKSQDLNSALLLIASVAVMWIAGKSMGGRLSDLMRDGIVRAASFKGELNVAFAVTAFTEAVTAMALALAPLLGVLFVFALLSGYVQVGSLFSFEAVKPNLNKLNPAEAFKNKFFKSRPYIELGKTIVKMAITVLIVSLALWDAKADIIALTSQPVQSVAWYTSTLIFQIGLKVGLAFLALGAADYFLQRHLHLKELKMTKQEVKDEYKETEGNPLFKSARKQMHQEILSQSMMAAVRQADVVLVNPTHVAVAIRYDRAAMAAPTIVAKGAELMAAQIREIAQEANVPMMRDVPLARALYELEIDAEVPEELYETVATVLRWVYQLAEERGEVMALSHG